MKILRLSLEENKELCDLGHEQLRRLLLSFSKKELITASRNLVEKGFKDALFIELITHFVNQHVHNVADVSFTIGSIKQEFPDFEALENETFVTVTMWFVEHELTNSTGQSKLGPVARFKQLIRISAICTKYKKGLLSEKHFQQILNQIGLPAYEIHALCGENSLNDGNISSAFSHIRKANEQCSVNQIARRAAHSLFSKVPHSRRIELLQYSKEAAPIAIGIAYFENLGFLVKTYQTTENQNKGYAKVEFQDDNEGKNLLQKYEVALAKITRTTVK